MCRSCIVTGILKIGSVYQKGLNYHLQVFLKKCKYTERDISFESLLSYDDEDEDRAASFLNELEKLD